MNITVKSITDLPNEVVEKILADFLSWSDACSFGKTGNTRFKQITESVLERIETRSTLTRHIV